MLSVFMWVCVCVRRGPCINVFLFVIVYRTRECVVGYDINSLSLARNHLSGVFVAF